MLGEARFVGVTRPLYVAGQERGVSQMFAPQGLFRFGRARGLSNEVASLPARVSLDTGTLLVFETPQGGT